jgi:HlyD family secretion protein
MISAAKPSGTVGDALPRGRGEGVDREIGTGSVTRRRIAWGLAVSLTLAIAAYGTSLLLARSQRPHVDRKMLTIAEARRTTLHDSVASIGTLLPRTTVYLDAVQGGRIDEVLTRVGSLIVRGQPVLRLSNDDLQMRLITADAQRLQQVSTLRETRFRMEQGALAIRQELADMDYQIHRLEGQVRRDEELFGSQLIPRQSLEQARDELEYYRRKRVLTVDSMSQESHRLDVQARQMEAGVASMESGYELMRKMTGKLVVNAPVSGQLTTLDAEVGEIKSAGSRIGQIDVLADGYRVRALIDEYYSARIERGQNATTMPMASSMVVARVYPEVRDGRFAVDLDFVSTMPAGMRRGQTIGLQIQLGTPSEAVVVPAGSFYRTTGGSWVYLVVTPHRAERHPVRLGRLAGDLIEVTDGLSVGDKIITSSYESFGDARELVLD